MQSDVGHLVFTIASLKLFDRSCWGRAVIRYSQNKYRVQSSPPQSKNIQFALKIFENVLRFFRRSFIKWRGPKKMMGGGAKVKCSEWRHKETTQTQLLHFSITIFAKFVNG